MMHFNKKARTVDWEPEALQKIQAWPVELAWAYIAGVEQYFRGAVGPNFSMQWVPSEAPKDTEAFRALRGLFEQYIGNISMSVEHAFVAADYLKQFPMFQIGNTPWKNARTRQSKTPGVRIAFIPESQWPSMKALSDDEFAVVMNTYRTHLELEESCKISWDYRVNEYFGLNQSKKVIRDERPYAVYSMLSSIVPVVVRQEGSLSKRINLALAMTGFLTQSPMALTAHIPVETGISI